jgi:hypothetical protein
MRLSCKVRVSSQVSTRPSQISRELCGALGAASKVSTTSSRESSTLVRTSTYLVSRCYLAHSIVHGMDKVENII